MCHVFPTRCDKSAISHGHFMLGLDVYFPMLIYLYYLFQVMTVVCVSGIWRPKPAFKRSQHTAKNLTKVYSTLPSTPQYLTSPVLERTHWPKFLSLIRYYSSLLRFTREAPHSLRSSPWLYQNSAWRSIWLWNQGRRFCKKLTRLEIWWKSRDEKKRPY